MAVRRVEWYCGPGVDLYPEDLSGYEDAGGYVIQPKIDGMWCCLEVHGNGTKNLLNSRDAQTGPVFGANAGDLEQLRIPAPAGTVLVGELEASSQWATIQSEERGYRRLHLFDVARIGDDDVRDLPWLRRDELLRQIGASLATKEEAAMRLPLVPNFADKFRERYDRWVNAGFEGCVIKLKTSTARPSILSGKIAEWMRCKAVFTDEYVFLGVTMTPGGKYSDPKPTGLWGLFVKGKLTKVMKATAPTELLDEKHIGSLVAEFKGWARMKSGALRHGQFVRVRTDKSPEECVLR